MADLDGMTSAQLKALRKDIDKALEDFDDNKKRSAVAAAQAAVAAFGYALHDLLPWVTRSKTKTKSVKSASPAKYRNPADPAQTWTGRGRKPQWFKEAEAAGHDVTKFSV